MKDTNHSKKKKTSKQIVALIGVILLAALYIATLLVAIFAPEDSADLVRACLIATVIVPIFLWIYIWMYGKLTGRHTIADADQSQDSDTGI